MTPAEKTSPDALPPPPPWGVDGAGTLEDLVSAALRPPPAAPAAAPDEVQIDLDDLDAPSPRLLALLARHFRGDAARVDHALGQLCGKYPSLPDYVDTILDAQGVPAWLLPYVDVEALGQAWWDSGAIWVLDDPGDDDHERGVYIFRG